jgi:hypothetical protein
MRDVPVSWIACCRGPDHVRDPERVVRFTTRSRVLDRGRNALPPAVLYDTCGSTTRVRSHRRSRGDMSSAAGGRATIRGGGDAGAPLGVQAARGRFFLPDEDDTIGRRRSP